MENKPFLLMNLPNHLISKVLVKSHLSDLVQTRSSCRSPRSLLFDRTFREAYNVAHRGTIMRYTHLRTLPRNNPFHNLGVVLVEHEDDHPVETLRIRGILQQRNVAIAGDMMLHLVGVWGIVLVFAGVRRGLLLINLWDGPVRRLQFDNMSLTTPAELRRGLRVFYGNTGEYVVVYADVNININGTVTVFRNFSQDEENTCYVCNLVNNLEPLKMMDPGRLVVPFYSPPIRTVIFYHDGLRVFVIGPPMLVHPPNPPLPPGMEPDVTLLHSVVGYTAIIDLVFSQDEETYGLRRVCLYELREDLSSWRLISIVPPSMLP